jgi:RHS repeat-associated protein
LGAEYQGTPSIAGLITQSLPLGAGGLYFYHSDHLGSSSVITDQLGSLVQHVEYVPFGEIFVEERASASSWQTPYLFNAKELDDETGLYYYGARYYDPRASVWLSVDPLAETYPNISSYVYCVNNPVNYVDPDGEEPTLSAYNNASKSTGIPLASMRAVYLTETGGNAYYSDGKLKILFERHYFHKATNGKFDKSNPDLSNKIPGGYGKYSQQHNKLERAKMLDEEAAYSSTSFTGFQIMGANYENTGDYKSAKEFGEAMIKGCEDDHLNAFVMFVKSNPKLLEALKKGDWGEFARLYNGPKYKENNYDTKMKNNYEKLKDNPTEGLDTSNSNQTSTNKH